MFMDKIVTQEQLTSYLRDGGCETHFKNGACQGHSPWRLVDIKDCHQMAMWRPDLSDAFQKAGFSSGLLAFSLFRSTASGNCLAVVRDGRSSYYNSRVKSVIYDRLIPRGHYNHEDAMRWGGERMAGIVKPPTAAVDYRLTDTAYARAVLKRLTESFQRTDTRDWVDAIFRADGGGEKPRQPPERTLRLA